MEIDGNVTEGVLSYATASRGSRCRRRWPSDTLDIAPYVETIRLLASGAHDWSRQTFDLKSPLDHRPRYPPVGGEGHGRPDPVRPHRAGANLRNGKLSLSIGEAQVFGGILRGSFGLAQCPPPRRDLTAQFQLTDIDLEAFGAELFGNPQAVRPRQAHGSLVASDRGPSGSRPRSTAPRPDRP